MRVIILAAGQGFKLDGFNKLLIKHPETGKRIIDTYIEAFQGKDITVVTGYRAINIMHNYPELNYVHNSDWAVTNNSYSLALALDDTPCYVLSDDLIIKPELIKMLDDAPEDCVLTEIRDNRTLTAVNCVVNNDGSINNIYQGTLREQTDPEAIGIYKISDFEILRSWKRNCVEHGNLFAGQNLPLNVDKEIYSCDIGNQSLFEINTPLDYIRLISNY